MKKILFSTITLILIVIFSVIGFKSADDISNDNIVISSSTDYTTNKDKNEHSIDTSNFEKAYVKRVVDGDTIIATIGDNDYRVRLIG